MPRGMKGIFEQRTKLGIIHFHNEKYTPKKIAWHTASAYKIRPNLIL